MNSLMTVVLRVFYTAKERIVFSVFISDRTQIGCVAVEGKLRVLCS